MGKTECLNCGAAGRVIDGSMCPACGGTGLFEEEEYIPTQLDRIEAKLDKILGQMDARPAVTSTFNWDNSRLWMTENQRRNK